MSLALRVKRLEKLAIDNSPVLLTAIGVVGTIGTAVLTHRAATRAEILVTAEITHRMREPEDIGFTKREHFDLTWKLYIPPVAFGGVTIAAIIMANRIGTRRAAAVAAAYTLSERAYSEYREKVIEKFGADKAQSVRDDIARDRMLSDPPRENNVVLVGSGDVRCYDMFSGRYFDSTVEEIKKAMNDTNYQVNSDGYASLTDFWGRIGLPRTSISDEIGWNQDKLMELEFSPVLGEDGRPCVAYTFRSNPVHRFDQFHP